MKCRSPLAGLCLPSEFELKMHTDASFSSPESSDVDVTPLPRNSTGVLVRVRVQQVKAIYVGGTAAGLLYSDVCSPFSFCSHDAVEAVLSSRERRR